MTTKLTKSKILLIFFFKFITAHPTKNQICTSKLCQEQAELLLNRMDITVNPCDDFYQFACGNYNSSKEILRDNVINDQLKDLVSQKVSENDNKPLQLMKTFYQICMDDDQSIYKYSKAQMMASGWPLSENIEEENFSWAKFIKKFQFGWNKNFYLVSISIGDDKFGDIKIFVSPENLKRQVNFDDYFKNQVDYIVSLGIDEEVAKNAFTQIMEFEDKFRKVVNSISDNSDDKPVTIAELQEIFPFYDWTTFLKVSFGVEHEIDPNFLIMIKKNAILAKISEFLTKSPKSSIKNYIIWRSMAKGYNHWKNTLLNQNAKADMCIRNMRNSLSLATSAVYVWNFFDKENQKPLKESIKLIKNELNKTFINSDWLDEKTKFKAIEKLIKMKFYVGYTDKLKDSTFVTKYYENFKFNGKNLEEIIRETSSHKEQKYKPILDQNKQKEFTNFILSSNKVASAIQINAGYLLTENSFMIYAGIIYNEMFSINRPMSMNFGALGSIIGHEIIHGFDNKGRLYDSNGNFQNWWEKESENAYLEKVQCLIDQYENYTEPITGLNVNGTLTLGENIADNVGSHLAYKSYQNWLKVENIDQTLSNFNFTSNQLFWITSAQFFCQNPNADFLKYQIKYDEHTPNRFRVIGTLGNLKEFSDDFQCPAGSTMNRKDKCKVF